MFTEAFIASSLLVGAFLVLLVGRLRREQGTSPDPAGYLRKAFQHTSDGIMVVRVDAKGRSIVAELNVSMALLCPGMHEGSELPLPKQGKDPVGHELSRQLHRSLCCNELNEQPLGFNLDLQHPDGGRGLACRVRMFSLHKEAGSQLVLCMVEDASHLRLMADKITSRDQKFRVLVEKSPDTIVRYDRAGHRTYTNQAFRSLALTTAPFGAASNFQEYNGDAYRTILMEVMENGQDETHEFIWQTSEGEKTSLVRMVPEFDVEGRVCGAFSIGRDITDLKQTELHLRESRALQRELGARRELELRQLRKGVAREMHEDYGQRLSMLRMTLSMLNLRFGQDSKEFGQRIYEAIQMLDTTIDHMREIVSSIHPSVLSMDVAAALEWLGQDMLSDTGIQVTVQVTQDSRRLDETRNSFVFRLVQTALSNVLLHAQASRVSILLEAYGDDFRLQVRDDGKGFDLNRERRDSLGMVAMEELANMLEGEIVFFSAPGAGTVVEVTFPGEVKIWPTPETSV